MFFLLVAGHALADFALQPDAMAACKNRRASNPLQQEVPWYYWMTAHALIHGLVVAAIIAGWTHQAHAAVLLGLMEFGIHWIIDTLKCEGLFNIHVDQALHVLCKAGWWAMLAYGIISY